METSRALLGANLKRLREAQDWSQAKLAEKADLSLKMIQKIEYGQTSPSPETLDKIVGALGVKIQDLYAVTYQGRTVGYAERTVINHGSAAPDYNQALGLASKFLAAPPDIHYLVQAILDEDPAHLMRLTPEFVLTLRRLLERLS